MPKPTVEKFYGLPYCSTCQKAEQHLKDAGVKINKYVNVKEEKITKKELQELCKLAGGVDKVFSKRAMKYRAWGLDKKKLSDDDMLGYMLEEYTFIKRPTILTGDNQVLSAYSKKQYDALTAK